LSKGRGQDTQEVRRVRTPRKGEIPGVVEQIMGHGKLKVRCADGKIRLGRIPGKMKRGYGSGKVTWFSKAVGFPE